MCSTSTNEYMAPVQCASHIRHSLRTLIVRAMRARRTHNIITNIGQYEILCYKQSTRCFWWILKQNRNMSVSNAAAMHVVRKEICRNELGIQYQYLSLFIWFYAHFNSIILRYTTLYGGLCVASEFVMLFLCVSPFMRSFWSIFSLTIAACVSAGWISRGKLERTHSHEFVSRICVNVARFSDFYLAAPPRYRFARADKIQFGSFHFKTKNSITTTSHDFNKLNEI